MSFLLSFALIQICISTPIHPEERIVNGQPIPASLVPWQASMRRGIDLGFIYQESFCGGSLIEISPPIILTAAHCVDMFYENVTDNTIRQWDNITSGANTILENLNIDLNRTYANDDIDSFATLEIYDINLIHIHEDWNSSNIAAGNDIALIIFSEHNNTIDPMPDIWYPNLPTTLDTCCNDTQEFYATGYGANASNGGPTNTLEITILKYMNKPECESRNAGYKLYQLYAYYILNDITNDLTENWAERFNETIQNARMDAIMNPNLRTICADGYGTDTCQGDSGGPLWRINDENITEIIGVVSYGLGCSIDDPFSVPAYYTNVAYYYRWIQKIISFVLYQDTFDPTEIPTMIPTVQPTEPSVAPTGYPTTYTTAPTEIPTRIPTGDPTEIPTEIPTGDPTEIPTGIPTSNPVPTTESVPPTSYTDAPTSYTTPLAEETGSMNDTTPVADANRICYGLMMGVVVIFAAYNI